MNKQVVPSDDNGPATRHVRVHADLADMIGWVHFFAKRSDSKITVAQILDPILRGPIALRFAPLAALVKDIEAAGAGPRSPVESPKRRKK